jgi:antitoxin CptB
MNDTWRQLALAARRGNTEAEQLLAPFIDQLRHQPQQLATQAETLADLLAQEEQDLLIWLLDPNQAPTPWQALLTQIRQCYQQTLNSQQ